ncbi:hypothetical protein QCA50_007270 [Cerrena zonata]|uniref:E2 ubiquitin-conjugating enzyme n=1 Tax=Cerrena zonata TaxID=2478898 RepID=A0AAW0GH26_9APHY
MPPPVASRTTIKRIHREMADLKKEDLGAIKLAPISDNLFNWKATMPGPEGSVYEGGVFEVDITLPPDYPFSAPRMSFCTRIYHMNISDKGGICIDILKHNWSPALSLFKVILSLSSLLTDPNPKDPLVPSIATEYVRNRAQHDRTARQWTQQYAQPRPPPPPPPPPPIAISTPPPVSASYPSSRARGKTRATSIPCPPHSSAAGGRASSSRTGAIVIDDSDDEASMARRSQARKRKREIEGGTIDLSEQESSSERRRKRVTGTREGTTLSQGEVIVIDD